MQMFGCLFQPNLEPGQRQLLQDLQHQVYLQQQHAKMHILNQVRHRDVVF